MKSIQPESETQEVFDFLVIGSGFGGSVSAMRLTQKGYRVGIIETGKRLRATDFPKTNWRLRRYLWSPILRCFGPQRITFLKGLLVLRGAGVGGGSLVYANTLVQPSQEILHDATWPKNVDWEKELEPHFREAGRMLGITRNPALLEGEEELRKLGEALGVGHTFEPTDVAVFFGEPHVTVADPYFSGEGPSRTGCVLCGGCMEGCRYGAKNTLDMNYLFFAEKWGAKIFPELTATRITPSHAGYFVDTFQSTAWFRKKGPSFRAQKVILAAGVLGTVEILLHNREIYKTLPNLSSQLGHTIRTNGESLLGTTSFEEHRDFSKGIAIGASFRPDSRTKIEACRYSAKSSAMRLLAAPLTPEGTMITRPLKLVWRIFSRLGRYLRLLTVKDWAKKTIILLVMQATENQMRLRLGHSIFYAFRTGLRGEPTNNPIPSYIPLAQKACERLSEQVNGEPQNALSEVLLRSPATAHILGGACLAEADSTGVVNHQHEVFHYPGLYVCDGSVIPCNLGVNPSFTITALAERFAAQFPLKPGFSPQEFQARQIRFSVATGAKP